MTLITGSISTGTLRSQDILPAFASALENLNQPAYDKAVKDHPQIDDPPPEDDPWWNTGEPNEIINDVLYGLLNEHSDERVYFGAHPDDDDFGFWEIDDEEGERGPIPQHCGARLSLGVLDEGGYVATCQLAKDHEGRHRENFGQSGDGEVSLFWDVDERPPHEIGGLVQDLADDSKTLEDQVWALIDTLRAMGTTLGAEFYDRLPERVGGHIPEGMEEAAAKAQNLYDAWWETGSPKLMFMELVGELQKVCRNGFMFGLHPENKNHLGFWPQG